jgi:hypothetical protein
MGQEKGIPVNEVLSDFRRGLDDRALMKKYDLSPKQLEEIYGRLVESGKLTLGEVDARKGLLDDMVESDEDFSRESSQPGTSMADPASDSTPILPNSDSFGSSPSPPRNWQKKSLLGIIGGTLLIIVMLNPVVYVPAGLATLMLFVGLGLQIWGSYYLVKGKGYHGVLSILGILSCLGWIILLVLPSRYREKKSPTLGRGILKWSVWIMAIVAIGIILYLAVQYYLSHPRSACDSCARGDVVKLQAAFEQQLAKDLGERKLSFDEDAISRVVEANALHYMVGPYYGWGGCTGKCEVLIRINRHENKWVVEGTALKGAHPQGMSSRYVYRVPIVADGEMPATIVKDVRNTQNGKSRDWNSYPYTDLGQPETCYTESMIQEEGATSNRTFSIRVPKGVPCRELRMK